ncbi:protein phosphatase 1 regulatory subunit 26 isoform X2 [Antennarius striatus]|uniref:protein phosphatase 1 regulatory subunit 26 isoform X2 n=1 Tax=Antennarius striatus TaxID=241820 RepID=UPI0035B0941E
MYLMNVPPVAATHTEWRTRGPHRGYSIPNFFNDSDTELSTRGTPVSDKVQMIIESLRSSQSSLEMGDEKEGNSLSGQEGHPQVCKVAVSSYVGAKSKRKGPAENQQVDVSCPNGKSGDSDSDDSVDRGIEEAILEYLKEKGDYKRKAEPCFTFLPSSKISRKTPPMPEVCKQSFDTSASNQFPKAVKAETFESPAVVPIKKKIKNKESFNDNVVKKLDSKKMTLSKGLVLPKEQTKCCNKIKPPLTVKVEDNSNDSSSDDGIEEAIQKYQLEKKVQENRREIDNTRALEEDSDSTSDDGIEEAIRCYQLEQMKEKSVLKPFLEKQKPFSKHLMHSFGKTSTENSKKNRLRKKKTRLDKERKSVLSPPSVFIPKNPFSDSCISRGNGFHLFKNDSCKEHPPLPKANTTAELMCAEAILDISKTVMPESFHHSVNLSSSTLAETSSQSLIPTNYPAEESDASSIDSEDGIEQEIRKFLEQKAQMQKESPNAAASQEPGSEIDLEKVNSEQNKPGRLSLTQRRKQKEENCSMSNIPETGNIVKETALLPEDGNTAVSSHKHQTHPTSELRKTEQSGDKSSSLDSDEDLDTAIKDLLKTKKKSKKKTRDLKRKSRKHLKDEERTSENASQTKKFKPNLIMKWSPLKKVQKNKDDPKDKSGLSKTQTSASEEREVDPRKLKATESQALSPHKEDSSSVDSDDSIEQEIRRFLAEKAKTSTVEKDKDGNLSRNGTATLSTPPLFVDIKEENQLAEIPRKSNTPLSGQSLLGTQPPPTPWSLPSVIPTVCTQSPLTSFQSVSPGVLEPADGAGAARTEQRRPNVGKGSAQDQTTQMERVRPISGPNISHSRSESIKWRQSLGLPINETRTVSRTSFQVISSKTTENASTTPTFPSAVITPKSQTPFTLWSSAMTGRSPLSPGSAETTVNTTFRSPGLNLFSARQRPRISFQQNLTPAYRSHHPTEGERESTVHVPKDKSVFVELESNLTNHVQVQSGDRSQGKEKADLLRERRRDGESLKVDEKQVPLERTDEDFIDEAECESDNRSPEKQQGLSTLSLSSAIDPGITIRPCIALTTEERSMLFSRICTKDVPFFRLPLHHVKRKLQFIPVNRNEAPGHHNIDYQK